MTNDARVEYRCQFVLSRELFEDADLPPAELFRIASDLVCDHMQMRDAPQDFKSWLFSGQALMQYAKTGEDESGVTIEFRLYTKDGATL